MFKKLLFLISIIIVCCVLIIRYIYNKIIDLYLVKDNELSYDCYMSHFIQIVSKNNYFMNYGLWDKTTANLREANENLVQFIFEKLNPHMKKEANILDVGCGYGEQDMVWSKKGGASGGKITAIDISEMQIGFANQLQKKENISPHKLSFEVCNALNIHETYKAGEFDVVLSLESAFHYSERPKFFKNAASVLKPDGVFIIGDIMLKNDYKATFLNDMFLKMFGDILHIPKENLIRVDEWKQNIVDAGFEITEYNDITSQTFIPYYKHFFYTYMKNKYLPSVFAFPLNMIFYNTQPFNYVVAVCKKSGVSVPAPAQAPAPLKIE